MPLTQPSTRKRHQKDRAAPFGNTLAEYAVIGCTVVAMSIAAFLVLGGNLNGHMQNLRDDMAAHILTVSQAKAATVKEPSSGGGGHAVHSRSQGLLQWQYLPGHGRHQRPE